MWSCETSKSSSKIENSDTVQLFSTSTKSEQLFGPCCLIVNRETVMLSYVHLLFIDSHCMKYTFVKSTFWRHCFEDLVFKQNCRKLANPFTAGACCSEFQEVVAPLTNSKQRPVFLFLQTSQFVPEKILSYKGMWTQFAVSHPSDISFNLFPMALFLPIFQGHHSQILTEPLALVLVWSLLYMHQPNQ